MDRLTVIPSSPQVSQNKRRENENENKFSILEDDDTDEENLNHHNHNDRDLIAMDSAPDDEVSETHNELLEKEERLRNQLERYLNVHLHWVYSPDPYWVSVCDQYLHSISYSLQLNHHHNQQLSSNATNKPNHPNNSIAAASNPFMNHQRNNFNNPNNPESTHPSSDSHHSNQLYPQSDLVHQRVRLKPLQITSKTLLKPLKPL